MVASGIIRFPVMAGIFRRDAGEFLLVHLRKTENENGKRSFYILYLPKSSGSRPSSTSVHFLASSVVMASLADRSTRRAF